MYIIIKGSAKFGRRRSEQEENIRKEWGPTMSDESFDKLKYLEKKVEQTTGAKETFVGQVEIDKVK